MYRLCIPRSVPSHSPLEQLERLQQCADEILNTWFGFLSSKEVWKAKFRTNTRRLEKIFKNQENECEYYRPQQPRDDAISPNIYEIFTGYFQSEENDDDIVNCEHEVKGG